MVSGTLSGKQIKHNSLQQMFCNLKNSDIGANIHHSMSGSYSLSHQDKSWPKTMEHDKLRTGKIAITEVFHCTAQFPVYKEAQQMFALGFPAYTTHQVPRNNQP